MMDEFSGLIKKIKNANKEIENELHNQTPLVDELDYDVEHVHGRINNTSSKLDEYLKKSSKCCLYVTILIEVFIIILACSLL
jgi:t-SNARE complex subunit (syntaxin)